jgi:hypothetical protein
MEAWCAGCPVAILNNGHGVVEEGMLGIIENSPERLIEECRQLLSDAHYRESRHRDSVANASHFDVKKVGPQWENLLEEMMR